MVIGVLQFELIIHDCESLKDKRSVVRSAKDRLHREHQVSVAEVAAQDTLNLAVLGLACVATDGKRAGEVLDKISAKLRATPGAELGSIRRHIISGDEPESQPTESDMDTHSLAQELLAHARKGQA
jgi:uncharacterized protein YlxP (DUF503 family)